MIYHILVITLLEWAPQNSGVPVCGLAVPLVASFVRPESRIPWRFTEASVYIIYSDMASYVHLSMHYMAFILYMVLYTYHHVLWWDDNSSRHEWAMSSSGYFETLGFSIGEFLPGEPASETFCGSPPSTRGVRKAWSTPDSFLLRTHLYVYIYIHTYILLFLPSDFCRRWVLCGAALGLGPGTGKTGRGPIEM